jgi:hypothetical protein
MYKTLITYSGAQWENPSLPFAVRFLSGERQRGSLPCVFSIAHGEKNVRQKNLFAVRFNLKAPQRNSLPCVFLLAHGKQFSPHQTLPSLATVTLCVTFAVR